MGSNLWAGYTGLALLLSLSDCLRGILLRRGLRLDFGNLLLVLLGDLGASQILGYSCIPILATIKVEYRCIQLFLLRWCLLDLVLPRLGGLSLRC